MDTVSIMDTLSGLNTMHIGIFGIAAVLLVYIITIGKQDQWYRSTRYYNWNDWWADQ